MACDGLIELAVLGKQIAQLDVGLKLVWVQLDCAHLACERGRCVAHGAVHESEIAVGVGGLIVDGNRTRNFAERGGVIPSLMRDEAEQVYGIKLLWHLGEHLAVDRLRFLQAAGAMACERGRQRFGNGLLKSRHAGSLAELPLLLQNLLYACMIAPHGNAERDGGYTDIRSTPISSPALPLF